MDGIGNFLREWLGAIDGSRITAAQMAVRAVVVYIAVIIIVRLGKKRFLGKGSAFDIILGVMLGAVAGRAISGGAPVVPSLAACAAMVALHWIFSLAAVRSHWLGSIIKGNAQVIVHDGKVDEQALHGCHLSARDLEEELRHRNVASLDRVAEARLERSGNISIVTKVPQEIATLVRARAVLIHSPSAGDRSTTADELARLLTEAGYEVEVRSPKDSDSDDLVRRSADLIVAAGGDGTVTKVVLAAPTGARVGVIPLGTANNIANSLGIAGRPEEIIAGWTSALEKPIDIWLAKGPWGERLFIEGCGVGALTRAAHRMDDKEITGHSPEHEISMARAALKKTLTDSEPVPAKMTLDDGTLEGRFLLLEILNLGAVGPRLPLAWSADPSDGLLEIGYTLEERYNDFCEWLSDGASPFAAAPVTLLRSRSVELTWRNARFRIGDEYWPETGMPEPRATHQASAARARPRPNVLIPRSVA